MTVTGKLTRRDLAQTMPVHADPLHFESASFRGVNQVTFSYRTPTDAAAKLLPAALALQLPFFKMGALSDRLVSSTPE